ncbi:hypothetical protein Kisp02_43130 [Kineosporia sp. NBRC 101731]|nr:hypothetical protein Kisp02_43130 [Kineosporia sp. NBRC 101731]
MTETTGTRRSLRRLPGLRESFMGVAGLPADQTQKSGKPKVGPVHEFGEVFRFGIMLA